MDYTTVFNSLPDLHDANARLSKQLALMGEKADLAELRDIFEEHGVQSRLGLTLLHHHFEVSPGERVVEFGNISTPWPVPANGHIFGGITVPRSWRFLDGELRAYEYCFNIAGEETYDTEEVPKGFIKQANAFLTDNGLADILGICTMVASDEGMVEKTAGRVSIQVPITGVKGDGVGGLHNDIEAVWSFSCHRGLESTTMKLARACKQCSCGE